MLFCTLTYALKYIQHLFDYFFFFYLKKRTWLADLKDWNFR